MFRSYRAFASARYRVLMLLVYPILTILCCYFLQSGLLGLHGIEVSAVLMCFTMIIIECISDFWLFGGIQAKHVEHVDFMKSSERGKRLYQNAIQIDLCRRFVTLVGLQMINAGMGRLLYGKRIEQMESVMTLIVYLCVTFLLSNLSIFISRFASIVWINVGVGYLGCTIAQFMIYFMIRLSLVKWGTVLILFIANSVTVFLMIKVAMKKVEDSYYDEKS